MFYTDIVPMSYTHRHRHSVNVLHIQIQCRCFAHAYSDTVSMLTHTDTDTMSMFYTNIHRHCVNAYTYSYRHNLNAYTYRYTHSVDVSHIQIQTQCQCFTHRDTDRVSNSVCVCVCVCVCVRACVLACVCVCFSVCLSVCLCSVVVVVFRLVLADHSHVYNFPRCARWSGSWTNNFRILELAAVVALLMGSMVRRPGVIMSRRAGVVLLDPGIHSVAIGYAIAFVGKSHEHVELLYAISAFPIHPFRPPHSCSFCNRRSSEIQGSALGKCLQAWPVYIQVQACGCSAE